MKHVVIVGAGVSGLATAYHIKRLARDQGLELRLTVLEGNSRPGGRVWTERSKGFQIELGANGFLDSKRSTLELCQQLGLGCELIAARPEARTRYLFWHDRLHKLPTGPGKLLRSGLLSWRGKIRLLLEAFVPARRDGSDESVHEFACRRIGREAAEVLIDALVTGIHAGDPTLLSVSAAFPRLVQLEREYGSLLRALPRVRRKRGDETVTHSPPPHHSPLTPHEDIVPRETTGEREPARAASPSPQRSSPTGERVPSGAPAAGPSGTLWSLRAGMGELIETLRDTCGAEVITGVAVKQIIPRAEGHWLVHSEGADQWQADAVVLACPSFAQAAITEALDPELSRNLAAIPYNSVVVVALGFRQADLMQPLDGFGYLSPQRKRRDVLGVLWSSSIFEHRAPDGMVLVQAMCGGWNRPEIASWDDDQLLRAVLGEVRQTMGIAAAPAFTRIIRWPQAIPQYHVGHIARVAAIKACRQKHPRLCLTGNSFRGVSVNDCTEEALRCASELVHELADR